MFISNLQNELQEFNLLNHPFYQRWSCGQLHLDELRFYGTQYYHHVEIFPRYISRIHSECKEGIEYRQILSGNLGEEEKGDENHPELWLRFTDSLGVTREKVKNAVLTKETQDLIDGYWDLCKSYSTGVGALYAYEQQVPDVAKSKIEGLKKFYNISSENGLKFFTVHLEADKWHSEECAWLLEKLSENQKENAREGAIAAAKLLWEFLDGIERELKIAA